MGLLALVDCGALLGLGVHGILLRSRFEVPADLLTRGASFHCRGYSLRYFKYVRDRRRKCNCTPISESREMDGPVLLQGSRNEMSWGVSTRPVFECVGC